LASVFNGALTWIILSIKLCHKKAAYGLRVLLLRLVPGYVMGLLNKVLPAMVNAKYPLILGYWMKE